MRFVKYTDNCELHEICEVMIEWNDCVLRTPALRASARASAAIIFQMTLRLQGICQVLEYL